ncbi:hypothetical protein [Streptomyces sp. NPDC005485]|uniref:hypothetical protein n=1 Tax=Streptomyces sp. NPDC005485 TaxID=3155591 RepID=UPI0033AC981B
MVEGRTRRFARLGRALAASAATFVVLAASTGQAGAAEGGPGFAAQARAAGLTGAEAVTLQNRVDRYLAEMGGTQVAANRIDLGGRSSVTVRLPGEKAARDLSGSPASGAVSGRDRCDYKYMCAFSDTIFRGDRIDMYVCDDYPIPWSNDGSWVNNQTAGTVSQFKDKQGHVGWHDGGAYEEDISAPWYWVYDVRNCG